MARCHTRRAHPGTQRAPTPRTRPDTSHIRARTVPKPGSPCCTGPIISPKPTKPTWIGSFLPIPDCESPETRSRSSTRSTRPTTSKPPTKRWNGSPTSPTAARHREYHDVVDKIIASGEEILAYHPGRRASNGPREGINNLHPGPTPRRSRVHQL